MKSISYIHYRLLILETFKGFGNKIVLRNIFDLLSDENEILQCILYETAKKSNHFGGLVLLSIQPQ